MNKFLRVLPWALVVILSAIIGLIIYVYVYSFTGTISEQNISHLLFGNRVEALNADLDKHGIRDIYREKVNLPLEKFEIRFPLATGSKDLHWEWSYTAKVTEANLEREADLFEDKLGSYCNALEGEMNKEASNSSRDSVHLSRKMDSDGDGDGIVFVCKLKNTPQIGFIMFLIQRENEAHEQNYGTISYSVSFDSKIREE